MPGAPIVANIATSSDAFATSSKALVSNGFLVTTSKALVTSSVAPVSTSVSVSPRLHPGSAWTGSQLLPLRVDRAQAPGQWCSDKLHVETREKPQQKQERHEGLLNFE